ncbi:MAG: DUF4258 domain-containing protein [Nitrospirae bacterium]|nr:DUF4258 domain-containing protein [Nitrospirota bacterium]
MNYKISLHAEHEMKRRQISRHFVDIVLDAPQQIVDEYGGKKAYQSQIDFGKGKIYLLRVIVNESVNPKLVVTVYKTSKICKYWRQI